MVLHNIISHHSLKRTLKLHEKYHLLTALAFTGAKTMVNELILKMQC